MRVNRSGRFAIMLLTVTAATRTAPVTGQVPTPGDGATTQPSEAARPPVTARSVPVLPGALLPGSRIVAYYGNPMSAQMGILGALPPDEMLDKLAATAREWAKADTSRQVRPALQLVATVAQSHRGPDGRYRIRHPDSLIARVADWAEVRHWLMILDVQVGQSTVPAELERLIPWLRKPWVHLALDPEFAMHDGRIPGRKFGTLDARDVNYAIDLLARIVDEEHLPPKLLVVHRFTEDMLTNYRKIKQDPRVQVVIDMDGYGEPALKKHIYDLVVTRRPVQFTGFKLFYRNDHPMMTLRQVLALQPVPLYIQYQ
ncbi:MAG: hypothetical protein ACRELE_11850 [Gemmatimonadales bacterium]